MQVSWTIPALTDLDQIQDHVALESPTIAYRLVNDLINRTEQLLSSNPMIGRRGRVSGTRELVVAKTSYIVVYRVGTTRIDVVAVVHGAREWPESFA